MTEEEFRVESINIEKSRLVLEEKRIEIENNVFRKNFEVLSKYLISLVFALFTYFGVSAYDTELSTKLGERKLDAYITYVQVVNKSWFQYLNSQRVDFELRQAGIDAFDELMVLSGEEMIKQAYKINSYFVKLYPPFEITKEENVNFNNEMRTFKEFSRNEFTILQRD